MKSSYKMLLFFLGFTVILMACTAPKKSKNVEVPVQQKEVNSKVLQEKLISKETAKLYYDNYKRKHEVLSKALGKPDTKVFWYSYEQLEAIMQYFKEESSKKGVKSDGILFYLGAYPEASDNNKQGFMSFQDMAGYTNLVLIPSQNIDGSHVDAPLENYINEAEQNPPPYDEFGNGGPGNPSLIDDGN